MPTEEFTLEQFKEVANKFASKVDYVFDRSEYTAHVWLDGSVYVSIRSSIGLSEKADSAGEDSIRV